MTTDSISEAAPAKGPALFLGDEWFDPLEAEIRSRIRSFIEELLEAELARHCRAGATSGARTRRPRSGTATVTVNAG